MSVVAKITVQGDVSAVEVSNVRDDGVFLNDTLVSVNGLVVSRQELQNALSAIAVATEGEQNW